MSKIQLLTLAASVLTAVVADFDAFVASKKADPKLRWEWWPFIKRLVMGLVFGIGGGAATELGGVA